MGRTLVTGATGFIGSHLTRQLLERGDTVRVLVRQASPRAQGLPADVERFTGDVRDRRAVRRALQGVERVFHLAGTTNLRTSRADALAINVDGTRLVLEEALRAEVERAVLTSSVAAIGPAAPGGVADERSVWDAGRYGIAYVDAKHAAEVAALRLAAGGLPLVIVNPAHVLGPGDPGRSSNSLVKRFLRRQIPAYVDGTLNLVGVEDVARGHLLADEQGRLGERYILGNRNFTWDRLFADLSRLSGVEPPPIKLPLPAALPLALAAERIGGLRLPAAQEVRAAALHWSVSSAKAKRELGWHPAPHEDCLEAAIAYVREAALGRPGLGGAGTRQPAGLRIAGAMLRRVR
jgi:dihydroflavonol-4-reductase